MKTTTAHKVDFSIICCPPTRIYAPLAGITAIKSYLEQHHVSTKITYFNIEISRHGLFRNLSSENKTNLMPYIYLYNRLITADERQLAVIKSYLIGYYSQELLLNSALTDELFNDYIQEVYQQIETTVEEVLRDEPAMVGFTSKFYQWIPASIFAFVLKKKRPDIPLLIGGWSIKDGAVAILRQHKLFDFACWGEGEIPVLHLYQNIRKNSNIGRIPRLVYREGEHLLATSNGEADSFVDMDELPFFNFDDFRGIFSSDDPTFPIERIRGCNWQKCRFCFLSQGYRYRVKSNERFMQELRHYIRHYQVYSYQAMDNDFIGSDREQFMDLLRQLTALKQTYPNFKIVLAEIITKNLDRSTIEAMAAAGFINVQIGLEALSQRLLDKMRKHQKLSENLFFIREAVRNRFMVNGLNVIVNTPGEEEEDILDSIRNLSFFRFFLNRSYLKLLVVELAVANYSSYLREIRNEGRENEYATDDLSNLIAYPADTDRFSLFSYQKNTRPHPLWETFKEMSIFYKEAKFSYKFIVKPSQIIYKEYAGRKLVNEISFDNDVALAILCLLQDRVCSFEQVCVALPNTRPAVIQQVLTDLYTEKLVYYSEGYKDIMTILCLPEEIKSRLINSKQTNK